MTKHTHNGIFSYSNCQPNVWNPKYQKIVCYEQDQQLHTKEQMNAICKMPGWPSPTAMCKVTHGMNKQFSLKDNFQGLVNKLLSKSNKKVETKRAHCHSQGKIFLDGW